MKPERGHGSIEFSGVLQSVAASGGDTLFCGYRTNSLVFYVWKLGLNCFMLAMERSSDSSADVTYIIKRLRSEKHITVQKEWVEACIQWLLEENKVIAVVISNFLVRQGIS